MKKNIISKAIFFVALLITDTLLGQSGTQLTAGGSLASGNYYLANNLTITTPITIPSGNTVTIDLNGYVLRGIFSNADEASVITSSGTLTIKDSQPEIGHAGTINENGLFVWDGKGSTSIYGGIITSNFVEGKSRKGISVEAGSCTIVGGKIMGCYSLNHGAAVTISSSGTFTMRSGEISGEKIPGEIKYNISAGGNGYGGAIYGEPRNASGNNGSRISITDSELSFNKSGGLGGAICGYHVTLKNCTLNSNISEKDGGAVHIRCHDSYSDGLLDMDNCTVSKNRSATRGGGISCVAKCIIKNSTISHNYTTAIGGGLYCSANESPNTSEDYCVVSNSQITNNYCMADVTAESVGSGRGGGFLFTGSGKNVNFKLDNTQVKDNVCMYYGGGGQIDNQGILTMSGTSALDNNTSILKGAGGLHVTGSATFNFVGGTISNNTAYGCGGGIHSSYGCTLYLNGGAISNNEVYGKGGGVHVNTGADLTLGGTLLQENIAHEGKDYSTCVITENSNGTYTWEYGPQDAQTLLYSGYGGGVLIDSGTCTMTSGSLNGNRAYVGGGGIALCMINVDPNGSHFEQVKIASFTLNEGATVSENSTTGKGAGVYLMRNMTKDLQLDNVTDETDKRHLKDLQSGATTVTINGGTISGNISQGDGGGIYQEEGAIIIDGTATALLKTNKSVNGSGGGIYLGGGSFTVKESASAVVGAGKDVADNSVLELGNTAGLYGGGIYCAGTFDVEGTVTVRGNRAENGGGICVHNGDVVLKNGEISQNKATNLGGGLFVYNNAQNTTHDVTFSGGTFIGNSASAGGGICAQGDMTLTLNATLEKNSAVNGGGVYIEDNVEMSFGSGIIRNNIASGSMDGQTAYLGTNSSLRGVGGGIFMSSNTSLVFTDDQNLGIYNNEAESAANDVFANGSGTSIKLPDISNMELKDFDVPGNQLYWVEDYMDGDTEYSNGTKMTEAEEGIRYQVALNSRGVLGLLTSENDFDFTQPSTKYICLDLGYDLVFVTFTVENLLEGDDVTYDLKSQKIQSSEYESYTKILFTGTSEESISKVIGLPSGRWKVEKSIWNWKYDDDPTFDPQDAATDTGILVSRNMDDKQITITHELKKDSGGTVLNISEFQSRKVNRMGRRNPSNL